MRGCFLGLAALSIATAAHAQTKSNLTLGLDGGAAIISDGYLADVSSTVSYELRGHLGYEHWTGFQGEVIVSYASWTHNECTFMKEETVYSMLGGVRYTFPLRLIRPFAEAAVGFGHNWKTAPRYLVGGGIEVPIH